MDIKLNSLSTKTLDQMFKEQIDGLRAGVMDSRDQEWAAAVIIERFSRLERTLGAYTQSWNVNNSPAEAA